MKIKTTLSELAFIVGAVASSANAQIVLSGVVDSTQSGGIPKVMEMIAKTTVAELSSFWIVRDTNGVGPFDALFNLPGVSLAASDFFYVSENINTDTSTATLGFTIGATNDILNWNEDDILGLATPNGTYFSGNNISEFDLIDSFGFVGQDDTDFAADLVFYRQAEMAANPTGVADVENFKISAYSDPKLQNTFGTYAVPEIGTYALLAGCFALASVMMHRRSAE